MFHSVRTRLTLWYAAVLAISLIAFALLVYYRSARTFYARQDEALRSTAQTVASAYLEELEEERSVTKANEVVLTELVFPNRYIEVTEPEGRAISWSPNFSGHAIQLPQEALNDARENGSAFVTANGLRVAIVPLSSSPELGFAAVAEPLSVIDEGLHHLRRDFFAGVPLILILASVGGYFLARKSLSPIDSMNNQTRNITAKSLSSRLDIRNTKDELGRLGLTINDLLSRLESAFNEQQRFIADASHELRTPLAVLRGETEVSLEKPRSTEEYVASLQLIKEEAEILSRIVEELFILARQPLEAPSFLMKEDVSLNETVRECGRAAQVLAKRKSINLKTETDSAPMVLSGDDELIKRMILNLLDNAVKYTPEGGEVHVSLTRHNGRAQILVSDTGVGISQADQSKVFDRFYRVDKARSRKLGGAGLGLSIVQWILDAHEGTIAIDSSPGRGTTFRVLLPIKP